MSVKKVLPTISIFVICFLFISKSYSQITNITITQTNVSCKNGNNGTATATPTDGTGPYTYLWSAANQTNSMATGLSAGNYTVVVTDQTSASATATVAITEPDLLTVTVSKTDGCNGANNGTATANPSGGSGIYTYLWSAGSQTTQTATGLSSTSHIVSVTDAKGCAVNATVTITQPPALVLSVSKTDITCNGLNNGTATANASGGTGTFVYLWNPSAQTTATATGLSAGNYSVTVTDNNACSKTTGITITQPTTPLSVSVSHTNGCNGGMGTATANPTGGTTSYTYLWTGGQITKTATGLSAGNYTVTVTDAKGCSASNSVTISQSAVINLSVTGTHISCNGGSNGTATVNATGGATPYTYLWTPGGQTGSTATGLSTGNYSVLVKDVNGCTKTASVTISQPSVLALTTSKTNVSCNGLSNGTATVNATGGTTPYTYFWTGGQATQTASGLSPGNYSILVTDANGCSKSAVVTISQPNVLSVNVSQTNDCGVLGTATSNASGGTGNYTYAWSTSPVQTTAIATGLAAGTYSVIVTDANGCSVNNSVAIVQSSPIILTTSQINILCNGGKGAATANASGGTGTLVYSWNPGGQTTATATGLSPISYTVTVKDANLCTKTATVTITEPAVLTVTVTKSNISCAGANNGTATAAPSGGTTPYTYVWTGGQTTQTATGLSVGNYSVSVTDANGCTKIGTAVITQPNALLTTTSQTNICNGSSGTATVNPSGGTTPYTYAWTTSPAQTTQTATGLSVGNYSVTVTDANSCSTYNAVAIVQFASINLTTSQTNILCNGGKGTATANASGGTGTLVYSWNPGGQTTATATGLSATNYTVTVKDANLCSKTATVTITEPAVLTLTVTKGNIVCNGGKGTATANASGGALPYTYAWTTSPVQTTQIATGLVAGNYSVTITDANSCSKNGTVSITQPPVLVTNTSQSHIYDGGTGSATVTVSGGVPGYTYNWSTTPYQSTSTATGLYAGTYSVAVTDASGCVNTNIVAIISTKIQPLAAGFDHSLSKCQNDVTAWGDNLYGQIGDGTVSDKDTAVVVNGLTNVTVLEGGGVHSIALKNDGAVWVWGRNNTGQLGLGTMANHNAPVLLSSLTKIIAVSGGNRHSLALKNDGTVWAWGLNSSGQLGDNTFIQRNSPVKVNILTNVIDISSGSDHSLAINNDSTVWAWGLNTNGQLGDGTFSNRDTPVKTDKLSGIIAVDGGDAHSLALKKDGTVWAWGLNTNGQLGDGTTTSKDTAVMVNGLTGIVAISAGDKHSLALKSNGTVWAWGLNLDGQLGDNTTTNRNIPVQVSGLTGITHIQAGGNHSLAVKNNGQVWAWGNNPDGQLGDGTNADKNVPVMTDMPCLIKTLAITTMQVNVSCYGGANGGAKVTPSGGTLPYTYLWTPGGQTTATIMGLSIGNFTVTVKDANAFASTATLSITQPLALTGTVSATAIACHGGNNGTATVNVNGGTPNYKYFWNSVPSQTTTVATGLPAGNYTVYISDAHSCTSTMSVAVTQPSTALKINVSGVIDATSCINKDGSIITTASGGTPNYMYAWSTVPVQTTSTAIGLGQGTYTLTLTDASNCSTSVAATVNCPTVTSIDQQPEEIEFTVFPNPSNGKYQLSASIQVEIVSAEVYTLLGEKVYLTTNLNAQAINEIDISHQPAGVYFLRIKTKEDTGRYQQVVKKIIKE